ncbi:hypothetical protein GCM10011529_07400 [Polymorphobacter glacialis]|uniref:17 kDa surface antigen n=1 Tax=Sandarakinorhabdus glacialis TaxID=1614636 RepID=A0A917E4R3_9SPHN|nr:glycine zipper 2TM domain-containing protein [Polymorphobacter glacialis]GGE03449.1 hypothetical protein GCM10011529_07400 [Polymorphobacter glacialis]
MRTMLIPFAALAIGAVAAPVAAQNYDNGRNDRAYSSQGEVRRSAQRLQEERRDLRDAQRYGDRRDIKEERRDVKRAHKEYRQDARDWQRGRNYNYNRPDPRYNGYYADNYYRAGQNYQPRRMNSNDRIYRGQDNQYYCRRNDGTTGLIIGALGGGVLGNVIAPGGSKTLGSLIGGGLGAVLGNSIGQGNVTCR